MAETPSIRRDLKRVARWAAAIGVVLGLTCPHLPAGYQAPCAVARAVVSVCTGGSS